MTHHSRTRIIFPFLASLLLLGVLAGCASPNGVHRVSSQDSYRESTSNPLNEEVTSTSTAIGLIAARADDGNPIAQAQADLVKQANAPISSILQVRFQDSYEP